MTRKHFVLTIVSYSASSYALPTTMSTVNQDQHSDDTWSTEAILGLIAVVISVLCCAVGLAWPSIRRRFRLRRTRCMYTSFLYHLNMAGLTNRSYKYIHRIFTFLLGQVPLDGTTKDPCRNSRSVHITTTTMFVLIERKYGWDMERYDLVRSTSKIVLGNVKVLAVL